MPDEQIDIYNEKGEIIGQGGKRESHFNASWHKVAHVWIYNSKGQILMQQRTVGNIYYSGLWDISAGGHVGVGEDLDISAARELEEEIGISVKGEELDKYKQIKLDCFQRENNYKNREFVQLYFLKYDCDINELQLQESEVQAVKWIDLDTFIHELKDAKTKDLYVQHGDDYFNVVIGRLKELI